MYRHSSPATGPTKQFARAIALSMLVAALGAPGASAKLNLEPTTGGSEIAAVIPHATVSPQVHAQPTSSTFDWGDAGIGAAGALVLLGFGTGGGVVVRRSRGQRPAITS